MWHVAHRIDAALAQTTHIAAMVCFLLTEIQFLVKQQKWVTVLVLQVTIVRSCCTVCYISEGVLVFCAATDAQCRIRFLGLWEDLQKGWYCCQHICCSFLWTYAYIIWYHLFLRLHLKCQPFVYSHVFCSIPYAPTGAYLSCCIWGSYWWISFYATADVLVLCESASAMYLVVSYFPCM